MNIQYIILLLVIPTFWVPVNAQQNPLETDSTHYKKWHIDRIIPIPDQASEMVQDRIASGGQPDVENAKNRTFPDEQAWLDYIETTNSGLASRSQSLAEKLDVSVKEEKIDGVTVRYVNPAEVSKKHSNHIFIHLHGGGYVVYGDYSSVFEAIQIAYYAKIPVVSIDYRMPPKHPFPAAVDDVLAVYKTLLQNYKPTAIAIGGTSAGGGLSMAAIHKFKEEELPLPGVLFGGTPWTDLTKTGDTYFTNEGIDRMLPTYDGMLESMAKIYAGNAEMQNPLISPIYGDFSEFPATYLVTGTRDVLLSATIRAHRKLKLASVVADLNVYEGISHAEYMFVIGSPENEQVYSELGRFMDAYLK